LILPRASSFLHRRLVILPGTINPSYRGDIIIPVFNPTNMEIHIQEGERLAQLVVVRRLDITFKEIGLDKMQGRGKADAEEIGQSGFVTTRRG